MGVVQVQVQVDYLRRGCFWESDEKEAKAVDFVLE
jgi:hypothetical protein